MKNKAIFRPWYFKGPFYIVSSYSTWTKIRRLCDNDIESIFVPTKLNDNYGGVLCNHEGELLFWHEEWIGGGIQIGDKVYGWEYDRYCDCEGVPCFSHITKEYVQKHFKNEASEFKPLTLDVVRDYFQRFVAKNKTHWIHDEIKSKELTVI